MASRSFSGGLEVFVRPLLPDASQSTIQPRTPPAEENPEAFLTWGGPSQFGDDFRDLADDPLDFHVLPDKMPPLVGTYNEEGRKWTDFQLTNPEDSSQWIPMRKISEIAFRAQANPETDGPAGPKQVRFTFANAYTQGKVPKWLHNSQGEEFSPLILDPFHSIVEVSWGGDFVLIALQIKPRTVVEMGVGLGQPFKDTGVYAPGYEKGNPEIDQHPDTDDENKPFMEQKLEGSIIKKEEDLHKQEPGPWEPTGMLPAMQRFGVNQFEESVFIDSYGRLWPYSYSGVMGGPVYVPPGGEIALVKNTQAAFDEYILNDIWGHPYTAGFVYAGQSGPVVVGSLGIDNAPADGHAISSDDFKGQDLGGPSGSLRDTSGGPAKQQPVKDDPLATEKWCLDIGPIHEHNPFSSDAMNPTGIGVFKDRTSAGDVWPAVWIYRHYQRTPEMKYDPGPFVYALFFIDVSTLQSHFGTDISLDIYAGGGDNAATTQGAEGAKDMEAETGRLRWSWHTGSVREDFQKWVDDFPEYEDDNPPSWGKVWEDLHFSEGIVNEDEEPFPSGASINDEKDSQQTYVVRYDERNIGKVPHT